MKRLGRTPRALISRPSSLTDSVSLGHRIVKGATWMIALRLVDRLIGAASVSILARLLLPRDFGVIALAVSVMTIVEIIGGFNVELALVRAQNATRADYDSAWTMRLTASLVIGLLVAASAVPAASFFQDGRVQGLLYVLAFFRALSGFENIGIIEFQRELDFRRDFLFRLTNRLAATLATLVCAYFLRDYRALIVGTACRTVFAVPLSYVMHSYRPGFSIERLRPLFGFSKWIFLQNLVVGTNSRLTTIILGRLTSVDVVAFFSISAEIARLATTEIQAPIRRAILPGFSKLASDVEQLKRIFLQSFGVMTILGLPVSAGTGLIADYAVQLFLGPHWVAAVPLIKIFALGAVIQSLRTGSHIIYLATNRPQQTFRLSVIGLFVSLPLLITGTKIGGGFGAAWATVVASAIMLIVDYVFLKHVLHLSFGSFAPMLYRPVVATGVMVVAVALLRTLLPADVEWSAALEHLLLCATFGAAGYIGTVLLLWLAARTPEGPESLILSRLSAMRLARGFVGST